MLGVYWPWFSRGLLGGPVLARVCASGRAKEGFCDTAGPLCGCDTALGLRCGDTPVAPLTLCARMSDGGTRINEREDEVASAIAEEDPWGVS